jgi:hypothetical protein
LNQYYTTQVNVDFCIEIYKRYITLDKNKDIVIEPSAGCGSFINSIKKLCNNNVFIDIDPKHTLIKEGDFLEFSMNLQKFKKVHVLGNPPFNLATKFIKKATSISDVIGFILPLSFRKQSRKKSFSLNFHCIHEQFLPNNDFYFNGVLHKVPSVFQI